MIRDHFIAAIVGEELTDWSDLPRNLVPTPVLSMRFITKDEAVYSATVIIDSMTTHIRKHFRDYHELKPLQIKMTVSFHLYWISDRPGVFNRFPQLVGKWDQVNKDWI